MPDDVVEAAAERAAGPQPLWALVPAEARARSTRQAARIVLDELDPLADLLAAEAGLPRTEALLAELLPTAAALHALADDGPAGSSWLADALIRSDGRSANDVEGQQGQPTRRCRADPQAQPRGRPTF